MHNILTNPDRTPISAVPAVARRLRALCGKPAAHGWPELGDVHVSTGAAASLLLELMGLCLDSNGAPTAPWASLPIICDLWTHRLAPEAVKESLTNCGRDGHARVHVVIDQSDWPEVLTAPWGFVVEHLIPSGCGLMAVSPDGAWMFVDHHGEMMRAWHTRFASVTAISRTSVFHHPDGAAVPIMRYDVSFVDGNSWHTANLRDPATVEPVQRAMEAVAAVAGIEIARR